VSLGKHIERPICGPPLPYVSIVYVSIVDDLLRRRAAPNCARGDLAVRRQRPVTLLMDSGP
jgi:hypothetical protein